MDEKNNFAEELGDQFFDQIILNGPSIIFDAVDEADDSESIFNKLGEIFESHKIPDRYLRALVADVQKDQVTVLTENYDKEILIWDDQYVGLESDQTIKKVQSQIIFLIL